MLTAPRDSAAWQLRTEPAKFLASIRRMVNLDRHNELLPSLFARDSHFCAHILRLLTESSLHSNDQAQAALDFLSELGVEELDHVYSPSEYLHALEQFAKRSQLGEGHLLSLLNAALSLLTRARRIDARHETRILRLLLLRTKEMSLSERCVEGLLDVAYDLYRYAPSTRVLLLESEQFREQLMNDWVWYRSHRTRQICLHILSGLVALAPGLMQSSCENAIILRVALTEEPWRIEPLSNLPLLRDQQLRHIFEILRQRLHDPQATLLHPNHSLNLLFNLNA